MNNRSPRVGLVLSSVPGYSETFFHTKINGLVENGFEVILFAKGKREVKVKAKVVTPYPVLKFKPAMFVVAPLVLVQCLLRAPKAFFTYIKLLRADGLSFFQVLERVYLVAHILPYRLDWLHFGFITQAIGKEKVAKAIKARMAASIRGFDISIFPLMNPGKLNAIWPYLDKLHTISDDLLVVAKENGLPDSVIVQKITPAIDVAKFAKREDKDLGKRERVKLLTVARLHWKKGLEYALEACLELKKRGIQFDYTIIGEGEEREKLTFLIHQLGLKNEVSLIGKLYPKKVITLLHDGDIYLQPSIQEGFCNSVLEAQAAGLLCVVSDAEGLSENILDKETGWIVPKRDAVSLVNKILEIIKLDKPSRREIIDRAVLRVSSHFTSAAQMSLWIKFYKE